MTNTVELKARLNGLAISVEQAGEVLGVCRATAYVAARRGDFPTYRVGNKIMVPTAPLKRMLGLEPEIAV